MKKHWSEKKRNIFRTIKTVLISITNSTMITKSYKKLKNLTVGETVIL